MVFRITFLGTGGGRHTTMYQTRCTGGMLIEHGSGNHLHVDPGPGALTQMNRIHYDLSRTDSLVISHAHPDHYSDAESVIEGMTLGGWKKRGSLYGSPTVIDGDGTLGPCVSKYHIGKIGKVTVLRPGMTVAIDGLGTEICRSEHSDPTNIGFRFDTGNGVVSYVSDTGYSDDIARQYIGSRVLILPVTTPDDLRIPFHLCTDDAVSFIECVRPELAVFIHLGIVMIKKGPGLQAEETERRTGVRTVAAEDLDILEVGDSVSMSRAVAYGDEWIPDTSP
ncbi:MAG: MBL fold metallo-hydrolase [Candidatus Methanoplasma sp.]|jgi:phosphoribosyl 1,2-cyclic phosphodiesterase|nr:MBL fold metallo-hydrolase [Candidatus Methanoplasma sp.]